MPAYNSDYVNNIRGKSKQALLDHYLSRFKIYETGRTKLFKYLLEKYDKYILPYRRGKHIKNLIRKIRRDPNVIIEHVVHNGSFKSEYDIIKLRK